LSGADTRTRASLSSPYDDDDARPPPVVDHHHGHGLSPGMAYILDLETGRPKYIDSFLERLLVPTGGAFRFGGLRRRLNPSDVTILNAHLKKLHELPPGEMADMVISIAQDDDRLCWLHFRSRLLARPGEVRARQIIGAAVEVTADYAPALIKDLERRIIHAEEAERRRIGRELHDSTIQHLVALDMLLGSLEAKPEGANEAIVREMRETLTSVQNEMRTFAFLLHPPSIEEQGLEQTLRRFAQGFARRTGLSIDLEVRLSGAFLPFDTEVALFRIAQEALMNVHRHAQATAVSVELVALPAEVSLMVTDDGRGMNSAQLALAMKGGGVGIASMRSRITSLGGALRLDSNGRGVCVSVTAPRRSRRA
jgi:signal transduction histidine kinase